MTKLKNKHNKTNVARLLDQAGIEYELVAYQVDESDLSATHAASQIGEDPGSVFKTLVLRGDRTGVFVCVVSAGSEIDLKAAARVSGNKSASMVQVKELLPLTGYVRGGCSPVGMKKRYPTFIDSAAMVHDKIYVSAGERGLQIKLDPADLVDFTGAQISSLAGKAPQSEDANE